nr:DUF6503 family protein [Aquimarina pacifica]
MKLLSYLFLGLLFNTCIVSSQFSANEIVTKTIRNAGGELYTTAVVYFSFRNTQYRSKRQSGLYRLERFKTSPEGVIHDVVSNSGLVRTIDNCIIPVADTLITKISDGVNSVHYFANLPYGLDAPAVRKELVGESILKGEKYLKIRVTFTKEGGGTDFEDEFLYWIHKEDFTIDYLAYKYSVNGGGIRFREAYNVRYVNGIRFVDYRNYKADVLTTPLSSLDTLFENKKLKLLSKIELKDLYVHIL